MNTKQIYRDLTELAEKIGITVKEKNLKTAGIKVKSGLCKVKGEYLFIMNKKKKPKEKVDILALCISGMNTENIYILPAIREILEKAR